MFRVTTLCFSKILLVYLKERESMWAGEKGGEVKG